MVNFAIVYTDLVESTAAGRDLGMQIRERLSATPDVLLVFATPLHNHAALLASLQQTCQPQMLLGCSSAGEFTSEIQRAGLVCVIALQADDMQFSLAVGRNLQADPEAAAREVVAAFHGLSDSDYHYRTALVFIDALHGCADTFIERLTRQTDGSYQLYGGGAGDNGQFLYTPVFADTEVLTDAVVVLEILSHKPIGIGASHSWQPNGDLMRVTEAQGLCVKSLNNRPAVEAFQLHAAQTFQPFDPEHPLEFFVLNVLGIEIGGGYRLLRVPLSVEADGSVCFAAEVPMRHPVRIMTAAGSVPTTAANEATELALKRLYGHRPAFALFFDCVATRVRLGVDLDFELGAVQKALGPTPYIGCNTHGQVARIDGQYNGFLHCTAAVCVFPE